MAIIAKRSPEHAAIALRARVPGPRWLWASLLLLAVVLIGFVTIDRIYAARALPGLQIAGVPVGSLDSGGVRSRLETEIAAQWSAAEVTVGDGDRTWSATNGDLGIALDLDAATRSVIDYGKDSSALSRLNAWVVALTGRGQVALPLRAADSRLERWVGQIAAAVDRPAIDGEIRQTATGLQFRDPAIGRVVDRDATVAALLHARVSGDRSLTLTTREVLPAVDLDGYAAAAERARSYVTPLVIRAADAQVEEDAAGLSTLLKVERLPIGGATATRFRYEVSLDETRLREWVSAIAVLLDRPASNARYVPQPNGTLAVVPGQAGIRLDQETLLNSLVTELGRPRDGAPRIVNATASVEQPRFTTEQANQYVGRMSSLASFTTYYPWNASRHANISTGAAQFDGVVIEPGGTFSFWDVLGPVTVERGYAYAGAIINNRSDESVIGGGLCQVSTTLFMAVARAGYQIDERHNHGYYIDRYPVGLDAAVFLPGADFRWTNDTGEPVVIRSYGTETSVTFEIFGAPTGRQVYFSAPQVTNFTNVPLDQPADPAFAPGVVVQGRDVVVSRTVSQGGRVLHGDVWYSHYVPVWGGPAR